MTTLINLVQKNYQAHIPYFCFHDLPLYHPPLYPYTILFLYNLLDLRKQIKFTCPLKTRGGGNYGFASWEALPPSIPEIVLKGFP